MHIKDLRIVFLGTPEFARACLQALHEGGCQIVGVVTAPDKPAGRGMKLQESAVKQYALQQGLPLLQPEKLKNPDFLEKLRQWKADLQIVVAFRMLPEVVWHMPPMGTVNLHASLLPDYRGAAPINWAIINGETKTGLTTFTLQQEIDTGNILLQEEMPIAGDETAGELHDRMKAAGGALLLNTAEGLAAGTLTGKPQAEFSPSSKHAPKIFTDTCRIDWSKPVDEVYNLIRGLSPHPGAFTHFHDKMLKIYSADRHKAAHDHLPGTFSIENGRLRFACPDGYLYPKSVQSEGKKRMDIADFLRGARLGG